MAAELEVPRHVFVHGFLLGADGRKMSKSLGNVLDPFEVIGQYGTDALRFYLMRDVAFGQDGPVGMDAVGRRYDAELANEYGNLASRTIAMLIRYRDGAVPTAPTDPALALDFAQLPDEVAAELDRAEATQALEQIWQRVRRLNRYVEERAPWQLAKDPERAAELDQTLASLHEGIRSLTVLLHPYMPDSTARLLAALGESDSAYTATAFAPHGSGATVQSLPPLFPKDLSQAARPSG
jgi:methionyl-tRNA synthetase